MTSNYSKRIILFNPTHMISMVDLVAFNAETPMINTLCFLEKEFNELINMNP